MEEGLDYTGITIVYFCHDGNGNFLMQKRGKNCRDENGRWDIGAGALKIEDSVERTLRKEIKEEYSTEIINYEFLGYRDVFRIDKGKRNHWVAIDFKVLVDKEKVANGEPHKFDEIGWFNINSLPNPVHSQLYNFLEIYKEKLN
jgi:8-oxo-dGTP pyrophosphatase MutT (NUDIX family)